MSAFTQVELFTDSDQRARFRELEIPLPDGSDLARLSAIEPATGLQFRRSPIGFAFPFHCSPKPQWVFILAGIMEIGLQDGSARRFEPYVLKRAIGQKGGHHLRLRRQSNT